MNLINFVFHFPRENNSIVVVDFDVSTDLKLHSIDPNALQDAVKTVFESALNDGLLGGKNVIPQRLVVKTPELGTIGSFTFITLVLSYQVLYVILFHNPGRARMWLKICICCTFLN